MSIASLFATNISRTYLPPMLKKRPRSEPLRARTPEQLADAARLYALYEDAKQKRGVTQDDIAMHMGYKTQGAVSQYLNGNTALNIKALIGFASFFGVKHEEISPTIAEEVRKLGVKRPGDRFGASKVDPMDRIDAALTDLFVLGTAKRRVMEAIRAAAEDGRAYNEAAKKQLLEVSAAAKRQDMSKARVAVCLGAIFLAGCSTPSTGVVPQGRGYYTVTRQGSSFVTSTVDLKAAALQDATQKCGDKLGVIHIKEIPAGAFGRWPEAEVTFRCD